MRFFKPRFKIYKNKRMDFFLKNREFPFKKSYIYNKKKIDNKFLSNYYIQLNESKKLKIIYGITDKKLSKYVLISKKNKNNKLSENIIILLESRLDNIVYRLGFGSTRAESRQIVSHKCVLVNNKICNIASYNIKVGDLITIHPRCRNQSRIINSLIYCKKKILSSNWIFVNYEKFFGYLKRYPLKSELFLNVNENLVFDFYSR